MEIKARNTNSLMALAIHLLLKHGVEEDSRNGRVLRFPEPVTIQLTHPRERVNFDATRDCNPFFHLMEALAMLAKCNSAPFLAHFAKNMLNYSDDGQTFNAFYGTRLRAYHTKRQTFPLDAMFDPQDQLFEVVQVLRKDPGSRQAVATLWDPADLMFDRTKDKACNLVMVFSIVDGAVRMSSYNRSNDMVWGGVMGANIVHLSMFQEYVACALGLPVGDWWHTSNNLHAYLDNPKWEALKINALGSALYELGLQPAELFPAGTHQLFDEANQQFIWACMDCVKKSTLLDEMWRFASPFIQDTAMPLFNAWQAYKLGQIPSALNWCDTIHAADWMISTTEWMKRRQNII